jgi:O-antigen/teichoic acid export membrane protein
MKKSSTDFVQGSVWITAGRLVAVAGRFGAGLLVARVLGPEGRGQYALLVLVPTTLVLLLHLGIGQANTFLIGRQAAPVQRIAANSLLWGGLGGTMIVAALLALWRLWQPAFLPYLPLPLLAVSCLTVPLALVHLFASFALLGLGQVRRYGILLLIEGIGQLAFLVLFMLVIPGGLMGAALAWTLTALTCAVVSVTWLVSPVLWTLRPDLHLLRQQLAYGLRIYPSGIMQHLNLRFDQFLVGAFAGAGQLGLYAVAASLTEAVWQIPIAISTALFSRVSTTTDRHANAVTPRALRAALALTALGVLGLLLVGRFLLRTLFGPEFEAALPSLYWLLPGTLLFAVPRVLEGDLAGRGHPLATSLAVGAAVVVTVVFDLLWIPLRGIVGAAQASSLAYAVNALVLLVAFARITGLGWRRLWWPHGGERW